MNMRSAILSILTLLALLLFAMNPFYVWNWGDDYLLKLTFHKISPLEFLFNDYLVFDGRSLNLGYLISRHCLNTEWPWLGTSIASVFYFGAACLLSALVHLARPMKLYEWLLMSVFFVSVLWLAGFYSHYETLYWQTGMLYVVEVFLFYAAYIYLKYPKANRMVIFLLAFISGIASPGAVIAILAVLFIEYFNTRLESGRQVIAIGFSGFLIGLLVVVLSPGSHERFQMEGGVDSKAFGNIHELYFRLHQFLGKFFDLNTPMLWVVILIGVLLIFIRGYALGMKIKRLEYLFEFRWLIAAMLSLLFYLPRMMYYITSPRLNIHLVFFSVLFFATQLALFRQAFPEIFAKTIDVIRIPSLLAFIVVAFYQLWGSMFCVKKMSSRIELYRASKGQDLVLKANDLIGPPATREFIDITEDSSYALNKAVAQYFGLKSIRKEAYR